MRGPGFNLRYYEGNGRSLWNLTLDEIRLRDA